MPASALKDRRSKRLGQEDHGLIFLADILMLTLSGALAIEAVPIREPHSIAWALGFVVTTLTMFLVRGLYSFRLGGSILSDVGRIAAATALAAMTVICARVIVGDVIGTASLAARLWAYSTVFMAAGRAGIAIEARRSWIRRASGVPTLIVGAGRVGRLVARRLQQHPELGLRPVGLVDDEPMPSGPENLPMLGGTADIERVIASNGIRHVIITFSRESDERQLSILRRCKRMQTMVAVVPRFYEEMTHRLMIEHLGAVPLLWVGQPNPRGWQFLLKHAIDRVVSAALLLVLAPILLLSAIAVCLSSPGPIIFRQTRVGRDGREFTMLKFRTMRGDPADAGEADAAWAASIIANRAGAPSPPAAKRVTRVGRILRRTSLDELPQLLNVLRGEMSLVGPRPERIGYVREFKGLVYRYSDRERVKSGITGWAQVHGLRGETSLPERVEWDNYYIENWDIWLDLKILMMTLGIFLRMAERSLQTRWRRA